MTASSVPVRYNAGWQIEPDERILEALCGEGWTSPGAIAMKPSVRLTTRQVRRRLRMLADGELVAPMDDDFDFYHITTEGELYLKGVRRQELHPHPFYFGLATAPLYR